MSRRRNRRGRRRAPRRHPPDEAGAGLVELVVAAALGLLALAIVAAVARGPVATALELAGPRRQVEGTALLAEILGGAVRAAAIAPTGVAPVVLAAGPDHVVLARRAAPSDVGEITVSGGPSAWWRLSLVDGAVLLDTGIDAPPSGPAVDGRRLGAGPIAHLVVRDVAGVAIVGPGAPSRAAGDPALARAAVVELHLDEDRADGIIAISLRGLP